MPTISVTFKKSCCNFWRVYSNVDKADILFPARKVRWSHCGICSMSISWHTFPDATVWLKLSKSFFRLSADTVLPGGLDLSPLFLVKPPNLKPQTHLCCPAWAELVISCTPFKQDCYQMPFECLSPLILSFSGHKKQAKTETFYRPCLFYLIPPMLTHLQPPSYTCTELTKVVWIRRNRTKHPLLWCTDALLTPVCPLKTAASSPPGAAPHIHNTLLCARWLSLQVLFPINQTVFELINNKSISRRLEMRVSRGRCLFVRWTSAALFLSTMELGLLLT